MHHKYLKNVAFELSRYSGCNLLMRWLTKNKVRIVTYHGVQDGVDPVVNRDRLQVPSSLFRAQLERMGSRYRVVPLSEVVDAFRQGRPARPRSLVLTFDDGYLNNFDVAVPILRSCGMTASFFITTGFVHGRYRPWWYAVRSALARTAVSALEWTNGRRWALGTVADRCRAALELEEQFLPMPAADRAVAMEELARRVKCEIAEREFDFMSVSQIQALAMEGFDVGAHTVSHLSMTHETEERIRRELNESTTELKKWIGREVPHFAYPYGLVPTDRAAAARLLGESGVTAAVTTAVGMNDERTPLHFLRRYDINGGRSPANLDAILSGSLAPFRS